MKIMWQTLEKSSILWFNIFRKMAIMDYNTGIREAREEGERKKQIEIAKKLLEMKISIEQIIEATNLTKGEIEKL